METICGAKTGWVVIILLSDFLGLGGLYDDYVGSILCDRVCGLGIVRF